MITIIASPLSRLGDDLDPTSPVEVFTGDDVEPRIVPAECSLTRRVIRSSECRDDRAGGPG